MGTGGTGRVTQSSYSVGSNRTVPELAGQELEIHNTHRYKWDHQNMYQNRLGVDEVYIKGMNSPIPFYKVTFFKNLEITCYLLFQIMEVT